MDTSEWLVDRFEEHCDRLGRVAYRMLGSSSEAEDAMQEAWIRFSRSDTSDVENLGSWLTTVVSRLCLTRLQTRRTHGEVALDPEGDEAPAHSGSRDDPEHEALLADSVGLALLVVLDKLSPAERVAFVLHDMFAVPFDDIAPIVGRSATATRQLASRARRRVQGQGAPPSDRSRQDQLVAAFLAATREGDFAALLAVLDPDVVLRADETAVGMGAPRETRGAELVGAFTRRARGAKAALVDGFAGAVWMPDGRPRVVFDITVDGDKIVAIDLIADVERLDRLDLVLLEET